MRAAVTRVEDVRVRHVAEAVPEDRPAEGSSRAAARDGHFVRMQLSGPLQGGVDTRCNPPGITYWALPRNPGSTSCRGAIP